MAAKLPVQWAPESRTHLVLAVCPRLSYCLGLGERMTLYKLPSYMNSSIVYTIWS